MWDGIRNNTTILVWYDMNIVKTKTIILRNRIEW